GQAGRSGNVAPGFAAAGGAVLLMLSTSAAGLRLTFLPAVGGPHAGRWWWVTAGAVAAASRSWRDPA
ncbi:MAG: hypothetical protein ACRD0S_11155, partial [Acidimicrobiales bacterium]